MDFGKKLKELRKKAGLTQQQLASQMNISKSVVSYYELNTRIPSPAVLRKISMIFHVSTDYLLGLHSSKMLDISELSDEDERVLRLLVEALKKKNKK